MKAAQYRKLASEHDLQVNVLEYLKLNARPGIGWYSIPNEGKRTPRFGARMKTLGMTRGVADLCIMLPKGRAAFLEMKTVKGRQSPDQQAFQAQCEQLGHDYVLARDLVEAIDALRRWGALKGNK